MNDFSERDGTSSLPKIVHLQHNLEEGSNWQEWNEHFSTAIEKTFGSKVSNAFQNGTEPSFVLKKASINASSAKKRAVKKENEETLKRR